MKKQKRGSRGAGWKWRWKKGGGLGSGIIRLRETEVRPGRVRGQSLVRVQVAKRKKISENGDGGEARVSPWLRGSHWRNLTGTVHGATEFANSRNTFKRTNGARSELLYFHSLSCEAKERQGKRLFCKMDSRRSAGRHSGMAFSTTGNRVR